MAAKKTNPEVEAAVSRKEFDDLNSSVNRLVDMIMEDRNKAKATPEAVKEEKEIAKAGPNTYSTDEEWDEKAKKIIGEEKVDHTEVERKGGGVKFTVVIKTEHSNAPKDYLDRVKTDRRTREVGQEGIAGVEQWAKLIKANLARPNNK